MSDQQQHYHYRPTPTFDVEPASVRPTKYRQSLRRVADTVTPQTQREEVHRYLDAYRCCPPPWFIPLVTILEVGVFVYYAHQEPREVLWVYGCPGCNFTDGPGVFIFAPALRLEIWRFLTYMLLHAGLMHILGNIILQVLVGFPLELVHGWRVAPFYLLGVIFGAMVQYTIDPNAWLVGASGGVYALIVAHISNVILNWAEMSCGICRLVIFCGYVALDVWGTLYARYGAKECLNVSWAGHLGGAITGLLLGVVLLRNLVVHKWERVLWWICLVLYIVLFVACLATVIIRSPGDKIWFECPHNAVEDWM